MKIEDLLNHLQDPRAQIRTQIAQIFGMVEETRALETIRKFYNQETDPSVKSTLQWAGKRIFEAQQRGYRVLNAMFDYFNVTAEINAVLRPHEERLVEQIKSNMSAPADPKRADLATPLVGLAASFALGGLMGGALIAQQSAMQRGLSENIIAQGLNSSTRDPHQLNRRMKAPQPSTTEVKPLLQRLMKDIDSRNRIAAAADLVMMNNPAALPVLAHCFINDPVPEVREIIERSGKRLYWHQLYFQMEKDGSLQTEIEQRLVAAGIDVKKAQQASTPKNPIPQSPPEDIAAILARAEEARAKKKKSRR